MNDCDLNEFATVISDKSEDSEDGEVRRRGERVRGVPRPHEEVPQPGRGLGHLLPLLQHHPLGRHHAGEAAILYLTQKLSSPLQLFREGPAAQARKQFLNSSSGRSVQEFNFIQVLHEGIVAFAFKYFNFIQNL